jgi:hypothetical protein
VKQASTSTVRDLSVVSPDYPIDEIGSLYSAIAERRSFSSLKLLSGTCDLAVGGWQRFRAISKIFP